MVDSKKVIAVVEDEAVLRKALNMQLLNEGYDVINASDGKAGLNLITANLPDVVVLDIGLPKMNGLEVLGALKANLKTKKIPVIILSNFQEHQSINEAMDLGAHDYFVKVETELEVLVEKIKAILG